MSFDPKNAANEELIGEVVENEETSEEQAEAEKASPAARKLEPIVLAHVLGPKYQPVKPRVIAKQLKLPSEQHKALKLAIRRLVKAGKLSYGSGHIVRAPRAGSSRISRRTGAEAEPADSEPSRQRERDGTPPSGVPCRVAAGQQEHRHRHVSPDDARALASCGRKGRSAATRAGDIYIAASATMDAADRDVVRVRLSRNQARGRGGRAAAGGRDRRDRRARHAPVRRRLSRSGRARASSQVDGKVFAQPIPVGDPGAKGAADGRQGRDRDGPLSHAPARRAKR